MNVRFVVFVAILLIAGCAQPQRPVTPLYREPRPAPIQTPQPAATPQPEPTPPVVVEVKPEPKPIIVPPEEVKPAVTKPVTGWVSLFDWCAANKLMPPLLSVQGV